MVLDIFFMWIQLFSGVILLFTSTWVFLSFRLKSFKTPFKISMIASVLMIHASIFDFFGNEALSRIFISFSVFLLSISFALLISSAKNIGLGR